ncbi:MAG: Zn-dependent hydrolase, partial [Microbacteriaceae bacterium]|nr:Zn-dependent hydrolase [Microbacteriaceae bacterium]
MSFEEAAVILERCDDLAGLSSRPDRLERVHLSPQHRAANDLVALWMAEAG